MKSELEFDEEIEMCADDWSGWTTVKQAAASDAFAINGRQIDAV